MNIHVLLRTFRDLLFHTSASTARGAGMRRLPGEWVIAAGGKGTWQLDGYLLAIRPTGAPGWITTIGATGSSFIVIGTSLYNKE